MIVTVNTNEQLLRTKSSLVDIKDIQTKKIQGVIKQLKKVMDKQVEGKITLGVAAPQLGVNIQIAIVKVIQSINQNREILSSKNVVIINPKIIKQSFNTSTDFEGCLSVPGIEKKVTRSYSCEVEYIDETGKIQRIQLEELNARVILHEIDHLNGILFIDY